MASEKNKHVECLFNAFCPPSMLDLVNKSLTFERATALIYCEQHMRTPQRVGGHEKYMRFLCLGKQQLGVCVRERRAAEVLCQMVCTR